MQNGELQFNNRPQNKLKQRRLLFTGFRGATRVGQGHVQRERAEPHTHACLYQCPSVGGLLWGFWVKTRLIHKDHRVGFGKLHGHLIMRDMQGKGFRRQRRLHYKGFRRSQIRNFHLLVTAACACLHDVLESVQVPAGSLVQHNGCRGSNTMVQLS